jgi:PAS domain S-box-containing protein
MDRSERFGASLSEDGRYRLLVEAVTDYAIYMLDPTGVITSWNAGARRFKGYEASEIVGKHFSQFYPEEDCARGLPQRGLDIAARENKFEGEGWRVRKDGTRFWAHVVIDPIRDPAGNLVGYAKITRDLTERMKAEEALRMSEEQFRLLVQGVTDYAIYMLDPQGNVASWNAGAERIKGYAPDEIIGRHFSTFYAPEDLNAGEPARALETAVREGRYEREAQRIRKDGSRFWAHVVIDPIRARDGSILGFAKITRDVTQRKMAERELEAAREALFQSQKMEAVGQLTGGIAHDFNNLLMAVLGSLEMVRKRMPPNPSISRFLDNAIEGAQRGAVLTQRMLAFARRQDLNPVAVNVAALVEGMMGLLHSSLGPTIRVDTRFPSNLSKVHADPNQLELAILNLAVNARDAMTKGGHIVIEAHNEQIAEGPRQGRYVCMSIKDNGAGMDQATLMRAMEPFFTTKGVGKGTGLGLSMVHGMVEQLGGKMELKSTLNEGTMVELWLPVAAPDARAAAPGAGAAANAVPKERAHVVLAVDDDPLVLLNTVAILEDLGHTVFEAGSGLRALEILEREPRIDLVVTDQAMPNMTGVELAENIRAQRPEMPIIMVTGYAELPANAPEGLQRLSKPFRQQDLEDTIRMMQQR